MSEYIVDVGKRHIKEINEEIPNKKFEILVVNDCSTDNSLNELNKLSIKYKNLDYSVFSDESPQNLGGSPF